MRCFVRTLFFDQSIYVKENSMGCEKGRALEGTRGPANPARKRAQGLYSLTTFITSETTKTIDS